MNPNWLKDAIRFALVEAALFTGYCLLLVFHPLVRLLRYLRK
jgi:hypothetical protein